MSPLQSEQAPDVAFLERTARVDGGRAPQRRNVSAITCSSVSAASPHDLESRRRRPRQPPSDRGRDEATIIVVFAPALTKVALGPRPTSSALARVDRTASTVPRRPYGLAKHASARVSWRGLGS